MLESTSTSTEDSHIFSDKEDHALSDWLSRAATLESVKNVDRKLEEWRVELEREFEMKRTERSERQVSWFLLRFIIIIITNIIIILTSPDPSSE